MNVRLLLAVALVSTLSAVAHGVSRPRKDRALSLKIGVIDLPRTVAFAGITAVLYTLLFAVVATILGHDRVAVLPLGDLTFVYLITATALISGVGHGMHCSSKNVSYHLNPIKRHDAYLANRVFHVPFSHHLLYLSAIAFAALVMLLEINHPDEAMGGTETFALIASGLLSGSAFGMAVWAGFVKPRAHPGHLACLAIALGVAGLSVAVLIPREDVALPRLPVTTFFSAAICSALIMVSFHATNPLRRPTAPARGVDAPGTGND